MKINEKTFEEKWLEEFAARVKNRMKYLKLNQSDLADQVEVSKMTVSQWLSCKHIPTACTVTKIAHALAVKPSYLIDFTIE
jgi:transcriptional regulator with XRE-family HTH domain